MSGIHVVARWLCIVMIAAIAACSDEDEPAAPLPTLFISFDSQSVAISQGDSATFSANVGLVGVFSAPPQVTITGMPHGITTRVEVSQSSANVATATVTIIVDAGAQPGMYALWLSASDPGARPATAPISLQVVEPPVPPAPPPPCAPTQLCPQWASSATASSEWTSREWSAAQATGPANVVGCDDDPRAWASLASDTKEWLEVDFAHAVFPTKVEVFETFANSSIVKVELRDESGVYRTVLTAEPKIVECPRVLTIPVTNVDVKIKGVRIHIDQSVIAYWNEIDAVSLTGYREKAGALRR